MAGAQVKRNPRTCSALGKCAGSIVSCPGHHLARETFVSEMTSENVARVVTGLETVLHEEQEKKNIWLGEENLSRALP